MFDVLVYLFHNYYTPQACPKADVLAKRLAAAGFEHEDIDEALGWLVGLAEVTEHCVSLAHHSGDATRCYAEAEMQVLDSDSRGFITFLENSGALSPALREIVIERAMACGEEPVSLAKTKVIALMVLWSQEAEVEHLILEELLRHDSDVPYH
jgi:Smg protein